MKKNPMNNQTSLSKNISGEKACPDLIISVRGSKGSKSSIGYPNKHNIKQKICNFTKDKVLTKKYIKNK